MSRERKNQILAELESNQAELRKNIEASEELIARSDELLDQYRVEHQEDRASGRR